MQKREGEWLLLGACESERATLINIHHGLFIVRFIFRPNFPGMRLPWECHDKVFDDKKVIAVITVEPAGKASFVLDCIQTRLMGQYNGN